MEPFFWPITAPSASHFTKVNADGSTALPEPYKPKFLKLSPKAKPVSGELTREQATKIIEDHFARFENEILDVINNQLNKGKKMNKNTKAAPTEREQLVNRLDSMSKKVNMALAKTRGPIKAGAFFTGDGQLLEFGDEIVEFNDVAVGSEAKVDGKPAEGEYVMPDGKKLVFEKGKVTEIKGMVKNRLPFKNKKRPPSGTKRPFHKPSK